MANNNNNFALIQSYPVFESNQVLTERQLNGIVGYLEQQDRLTRVCLLGMGIVCGLDSSWDESGSGLYITPGHGVTSEGYLVKIAPPLLTHYRLREVPTAWFGLEADDVIPTRFSGVLDLITEPEFEEDDVFVLSKNDLNDKVLVLVLECLQDDNDALCGNDCDEKGKEINFIVHEMLLSKADADLVLRCTYDPQGNNAGGIFDSLDELFYYRYFTSHPFVERFGYAETIDGQTGEIEKAVRLTNIINYDYFQDRYQKILVALCDRIDEALQNVHKVFSPVFAPEMVNNSALSLNPELKDRITNGTFHRFEVQYLYDHLCDLVHAHLEFMDTVYDLIADCPPDMHRFPKHLWLRKFSEAGEPELDSYTLYRTPYTQPQIYNGNRQRLAEASTLFQRLRLLTQAYQLPDFAAGEETKVTPSKNVESVLSQRAVPYYYGQNNGLFTNWNPQRKRVNRAGQVYGYHRPGTPPYNDPLIFQMEGSNFFRIEGHVGKDYNEVLTQLSDMRLKYNLPFEVVALKIGEEFDEELFQFFCEDFDCEKKEHQHRYDQFREALNTELDRFANNTGITGENVTFVQFPVFAEAVKALQVSMTESLDDYQFTAFETAYDFAGKLLQEQFQYKLSTSKTGFREVSECNEDMNKRIEEVKQKHLFHHFAKAHPGLEHKAGVPVGGTFIIAYVDAKVADKEIKELIAFIDGLPLPAETKRLRKELARQSRLVVADFYLPYTCISCCPPICYVAARPQPILLVSPTVFCEGDTTAHELTITAHPSGGIVTGSGYKFENGQHLFVPANAGISEGTVALKYFIDGGEAVADLTIVKRPNATFQVLDAAGTSVDSVCVDNDPLILIPDVAEGNFTAWNGSVELENVIAKNDNGVDEFNPANVPVEAGEPIVVEIRYAVAGNFCDNLFNRLITVFPVPNAAFSFPNDITEICKENGPISLLPVEPGGTFTAHINNSGPITGATLENLGQWSFDPGVITLEPGDNVVVNIRRRIVSDGGCDDVVNHDIIVWSSSEVDFKMPDFICQNNEPILLAPSISGGTFTARVVGGTTPANLINDNELFPGTITLDERVEVSVTYTLSVGPCIATRQRSIIVLPPPVADFEATFLTSEGQDLALVRIFNIQPAGGIYQWASVPDPVEPIKTRTDNQEFIVQYLPSVVNSGAISLSLTVDRGECQSVTVEKSVKPIINFFAFLEVVEGDSGLEVISNRILSDGDFISVNTLESELFNIRAFPLPSAVKQVKFELNGPVSASSSSEDVFSGYDLVEGGTLAVAIGDYTLKATPISMEGVVGEPKEISFSIVEDNDRLVVPPPADFSAETLTFLRRRDGSYRSQIKDLETDTGLAKTESFLKTQGFLSFQNGQNELSNRYEQAITALLEDTKKAKKGSPRRQKLLQLMAIATQHFMDRHVVASVKEAPVAALEVLTEQLSAMKNLGLDVKALKKAWQGNKLKKQLDAAAVDAFNAKLK